MPKKPNFELPDVLAYLEAAHAAGKDINAITPTDLQSDLGGRFSRCASLLAAARAQKLATDPQSCSQRLTEPAAAQGIGLRSNPAESSEPYLHRIDARLDEIALAFAEQRDIHRQLLRMLASLEEAIAVGFTHVKTHHDAASEIQAACVSELVGIKRHILALGRLMETSQAALPKGSDLQKANDQRAPNNTLTKPSGPGPRSDRPATAQGAVPDVRLATKEIAPATNRQTQGQASTHLPAPSKPPTPATTPPAPQRRSEQRPSRPARSTPKLEGTWRRILRMFG